MVTIGTGRTDPRAWVRAAYLLLDAAGQAEPGGKLPSQAQVTAQLGVSTFTVRHACQELARLGLARLVPGHGYYDGKRRAPR
jgi:DNA-binding FadR family transcriptional regulator